VAVSLKVVTASKKLVSVHHKLAETDLASVELPRSGYLLEVGRENFLRKNFLGKKTNGPVTVTTKLPLVGDISTVQEV
jgi:hypothetical protein